MSSVITDTVESPDYDRVVESPSRLLQDGARSRTFVLLLLFLMAFGVRLFYIQAIDFAPARQHRSAILARAYYHQLAANVPEWEKIVSVAQRQWLDLLEPPVMEVMAAGAYVLVGGEHLWIPKSFSVCWWLLGGLWLYLLARGLFGFDAALVATAFMLFLPFGALASRSFQPHPLMVMLFVGSLLRIWRYSERPALSRLVIASVVASASVFVYAPSLILIATALVALRIHAGGVRNLFARDMMVFGLLTVTPSLFYYGYGFVKGWGVRGQFLSSFNPALFLNPIFWAGWLAQIDLVIGFAALVAALIGFTLSRGTARALLVGLWSGYIVYGLVFTYHISTHDYYQLILVPIVALSLAPTVVSAMNHIGGALAWRSGRLAVFTLAVVLAMASIGATIIVHNYDRHGRWQRNEREIAVQIGERVHHSTRTVFLSISDGMPLVYYGKIAGTLVLQRNEAFNKFIANRPPVTDPGEFLSPQYLGFEPEYFIVTEILESKKQVELMRYLSSHYPLIAREVDYWIYDLRTPLPAKAGRGL